MLQADNVRTMMEVSNCCRLNFNTLSALSLLTILIHFKTVSSIGCFVCSSINGSDPQCEDTFNGNPSKYYKNDCFGGRKGRSGLFPADSCIKLKAELGSYKVMVRDCSVDNGETTSDTEMGRESHCWMVNMVNFNDVLMHGCSLACKTDGCNTGSDVKYSQGFLLMAALLSMAAVLIDS